MHMKVSWKVYAVFILLTEAVGGLSGFLTREGVALYQAEIIKPALNTPAMVFPVVWAILYALMGISAARIWMAEPSKARTYGLAVFGVQLAVNFFWSIIFFNLQAFGFAAFWLMLLWLMIVAMLLLFRRVDRLAAWLQVPYLLSVTLAGDLNVMGWLVTS